MFVRSETISAVFLQQSKSKKKSFIKVKVKKTDKNPQIDNIPKRKTSIKLTAKPHHRCESRNVSHVVNSDKYHDAMSSK